jgi:hypothetical protein
VPPVLNQFVTRALDKNQAETLFKLMLKYRCAQQSCMSGSATAALVVQCTHLTLLPRQYGWRCMYRRLP